MGGGGDKVSHKKIPGFDLELVDFNPSKMFEDFNKAQTEHLEQLLEETGDEMERKELEEAQYKKEMLDTLIGIKQNTDQLGEMTALLQASNEKQEEIFGLIVNILEINKAKDLIEAETKYRKVMSKIGTFTGDVKAIQSLGVFANSVFEAYKKYKGL
jgi:hypothetical protein